MNKQNLISLIEKYHLDGLIESTKYSILNNVLNVNFVSPTKDLVGDVYLNNFKFPTTEFIINNTTNFKKLLNITDNEIHIEKKEIKRGFDCIFIKDSTYELEYILSDFNINQNIPQISEPNYPIQFELNESNIINFIKAKKSLDTEIVVIDITSNTCTFTIGGDVDYSNKVKIEFPLQKENNLIPGIGLKFNADYIKNIFNNNKDIKNGICYISEEGLMKIVIECGDISCVYYLVAKE